MVPGPPIRPEVMIETGVAQCASSRVVFEALTQDHVGHLVEHRCAVPGRSSTPRRAGVVVIDACRPRWTYLEASSIERLQSLVAEVGPVDIVIRDSVQQRSVDTGLTLLHPHASRRRNTSACHLGFV